MSHAIVGLDLSLTGTGVARVPLAWDGNWSKVQTSRIGYALTSSADERDHAIRRLSIARSIVAHCYGSAEVYIEGYAYGARNNREALGELGGVVKDHLFAEHIPWHVVTVSAARKLLLGKVPKSKPKEAVREALISAGAPQSWSLDEYDAMCIANYGLSEEGGYCFCAT